MGECDLFWLSVVECDLFYGWVWAGVRGNDLFLARYWWLWMGVTLFWLGEGGCG